MISFALGDPGDLVRQAHDAGAREMLQVTRRDVKRLLRAAEVSNASRLTMMGSLLYSACTCPPLDMPKGLGRGYSFRA